MITYYCPACWQIILGTEEICPFCGFELAHYNELSYEEKLLGALQHPAPEKRMLAIQLLGELKSQRALPGLEKLVDTEINDIYTLMEALVAVSKIPGSQSLKVLQKAVVHPYPIIRQLAKRLLGKDMYDDLLSKPCVFILVRHGQTEWNRFERFRGRADVPLNTTGLAQAEATGNRVAVEWIPNVVYSSPLSRAVKTAEAISIHFNLPVKAHPGLIDIDYGEWQGFSPEEARRRWPEQVEHWYQRPEKAIIPGGETLTDLRIRLMETIKELAAHHAGEKVVLVGHTVINRIILLGILGLGNERFWHIKQDTCAINVFEALQGDFTLVSLNDTCHLHSISS